MSLFDQVNDDIKSAMLAKEKEKLEALRAIKAALQKLKKEQVIPFQLMLKIKLFRS
jgi:uncharacterized protein YqeY